jgi:hypothetical protein
VRLFRGLKLSRGLMVLVAFASSVALVLAPGAFGQGDPIVYPKVGQSLEQLEQDKYDCNNYARSTTGFDPYAAQAGQQQQQQQGGGQLKSVAKGAVRGALFGVAWDGDARPGANSGAVGGAVLGRMKGRSKNKMEKEAAEKKAAEQAQLQANYGRAWGACLEARQYIVK